MNRREFIGLLGGVAAGWSLAARGQQADRVARIGYLDFASPAISASYIGAFREGLRSLGYIEGENLKIEFRFAQGDNDLLPDLAIELIRLNVDVIVTYATGVPAAQRATSTIPIVMATYSDAVVAGIVASLANPGGNVTGSTFFNPELMAKRLELLKETAPSMRRAGVLLFQGSAMNRPMLAAMEHTAKALGVELQPIEVDRPTDLEGAFSVFAHQQVGGLVVGDHVFFRINARPINVLAEEHRLPSIGRLELATTGGLMAYGVDFLDQFRRAAAFVDKILKGIKPRDIPVEQATKFVTIANLKTAKALGLTLPPTLLARADEVIE
jgi:putative tryptophan/tyrosine transport system substrate-binding protein